MIARLILIFNSESKLKLIRKFFCKILMPFLTLFDKTEKLKKKPDSVKPAFRIDIPIKGHVWDLKKKKIGRRYVT